MTQTTAQDLQACVDQVKPYLIDAMMADPNIEPGKPFNIGQAIRRFFESKGLDECPFYTRERYETGLRGISKSQYVEYWNTVGQALDKGLWLDINGERGQRARHADLHEAAFLKGLSQEERDSIDAIIAADGTLVPKVLKAAFQNGLCSNSLAYRGVVEVYGVDNDFLLGEILHTPFYEMLAFQTKKNDASEREQAFYQAGQLFAQHCRSTGQSPDPSAFIESVNQVIELKGPYKKPGQNSHRVLDGLQL